MAIKRITTNLKKDSDIATADIANNAITAAKITDGNITTAKLADLTIKKTGVVGGGSLTLDPGSDNDIVVEEGGVITVTSSDTLPGTLTVGSSDNPITKFDMQGTTSKLNV